MMTFRSTYLKSIKWLNLFAILGHNLVFKLWQPYIILLTAELFLKMIMQPLYLDSGMFLN